MADRAQLLNDVEEAMRLVLDGRQSSIWSALPGIVQSVDFVAMTCTVQPAIKGVVEDENGAIQSVDLPLLVDVPLVFPNGGGFYLTFPVAVGDEALVIFSSRCIDAWWQSGGIQRPMEARMHDLSDGFAIVGPLSQPRVPAITSSSNAFQIRNSDNTAIISIHADGTIQLAVTALGKKISLVGDVDVTGTLTAAVDVVGGGKSLKTHTHPVSVPSTPFSGNTGAPS